MIVVCVLRSYTYEKFHLNHMVNFEKNRNFVFYMAGIFNFEVQNIVLLIHEIWLKYILISNFIKIFFFFSNLLNSTNDDGHSKNILELLETSKRTPPPPKSTPILLNTFGRVLNRLHLKQKLMKIAISRF